MSKNPTLNYELSESSRGIIPSVMTNVLKWTNQPGIISFAGGMPDPKLFPLEKITEAARKIAENSGHIILQYSTARGHKGLREFFAAHFKKKGIKTNEQEIIPVCGVQQGIYLSAKLLMNNGDKILIAGPSYFGALETFDSFLPQYLTIPLTEDGFDLKELERIFKIERPKFFYVITNFQNPSGISIPEEQRPLIAELAVKYNIPIIEDDVFGDLYFENPLKPLKVYAPEHVIYLTSLSKTLSAGFRIGFIVPPKHLVEKFILSKQLSDVSLNTYVQYLAYEICKDGTFENLLKELRSRYKERRDAMLDALEKNMKHKATWTHPKGGLFLWLYLKNKGIDAKELLESCAQDKLVFLHGASFFPHGKGGESELRLSYSNLPPDKIYEGIKILATHIALRI
ncbi:MAG: PLP-dependent aminotransferase family protein [Candidatus Gracilibacteria bacterium]|jgi:2-aminoadipate transaminase